MNTTTDLSPTDSRPASPGTAPSAWQNARHVVRMVAAGHPRIYLPMARRRYPGPSPDVIGPDTELVIDGYNRSANTFSVYAFQLAQHRPVRLAHHLHAPAQVIAAVQRGLPAIVVIRDPRGAVLSQAVREPHVSLRYALWAYTRFYRALMPYRTAVVVSDFERSTKDFGAVIREVNERYGTSFDEFVHNEANVARCRELMNQRPLFVRGLDPVSWTRLAFEAGLVGEQDLRDLPPTPAGRADSRESYAPSSERTRAKAALAREWEGKGLTRLRERAYEIYAAFARPAG